MLNAANIYFTEKDKETAITIEKLSEAGYLEDPGTFATGNVKEAVVNKVSDGSNTLTGKAVYSGGVEVHFNAATIQDITKDERSAKEFKAKKPENAKITPKE